jgi:hypothetical protein
VGARVRFLLYIVAFLACGQYSIAQQLARSPEYLESAKTFNAMPVGSRLLLQVLLTVDGTWQAVPNLEYNSRIAEAIALSRIKHSINGSTDGWFQRLEDETKPFFDVADFEMVRHPFKNVSILVPKGLVSRTNTTANGIEFASNLLELNFNYRPSI